jgi:hypothetical protein
MSTRNNLPPVKPAPQWLRERNARLREESKPLPIERVRQQVAASLRERFPDGPLKPETLTRMQEEKQEKAATSQASRRLTPSEIESLRQDSIQAGKRLDELAAQDKAKARVKQE